MHFLAQCKSLLLTGLSPLWSFYLRMRGVSVGKKLTCIGRPGINRKRGSLIQLGNQVTLCSSGIANPVAEGGRCRLATHHRDAKVVIHDKVGISSALICSATSVEIGEGTLIGGNAMILDTDFHPRKADGTLSTDPFAVSKPVKIGKHCFIGARAIILKGVTIGDGATIGAGAVISKNVPAGTTVVGLNRNLS